MASESIKILYFDDDIIVIDKPAGLLSIPDRFNKFLPDANSILSNEYGEVFTVHRLDKDTGGVMIYARNAESHKNLNEQFEERQVKKIYHAIVAGKLPKNEIAIDIPLLTDPAGRGGVIPSARGKESLTEIRVIEQYRIAALIECNLVTGRQHQLRAHVAAIGHPLLVDPHYGTSEAFYLSMMKRNYKLQKEQSEKPIINRITMQSKIIEINHPRSGKLVRFECDYPKDFDVLIKILRKYAK
jgi:RluA family pseudouridine synthase